MIHTAFAINNQTALIYTECFIHYIMVLSFFILGFFIFRLTFKSISRSMVVNLFQDHPEVILNEFRNSMKNKILNDIVNDAGFKVNVIKLKHIKVAVLRKINRNLLKYINFKGPRYPSYKLEDKDIFIFHYTLERMKEPWFLDKVVNGIFMKEFIDVKRLRYATIYLENKNENKKTLIMIFMKAIINFNNRMIKNYLYILSRRLLDL